MDVFIIFRQILYRHRANLDVGGGDRINSRYSVFLSARDILSTPIITMEQVGSSPAIGQLYGVDGTD
ncbi:MAG: hypothetical protein HZC55_02770 [Verrucomicrobia bacterium]|nr:hypothetical protein [Verrucomicrobiota bacterium]